MEPVSILIPTRFDNRWAITLTLETIRKYTRYPYRIVVGDAGMDEETAGFLKAQTDVSIVSCKNPFSPKNHLARVVQTSYFLFLHDDAQIVRHGWLKRRVDALERKANIGLVGPFIFNHPMNLGPKKSFSLFGFFKRPYFYRLLVPPLTPLKGRFFPFGMLVRKEMQNELDLHWGKIGGFDTGSIAYLQYLRYNMRKDIKQKWRFINYPYDRDIKHWANMSWPVREKQNHPQSMGPDLCRLLKERKEKIRMIQKILNQGTY